MSPALSPGRLPLVRVYSVEMSATGPPAARGSRPHSTCSSELGREEQLRATDREPEDTCFSGSLLSAPSFDLLQHSSLASLSDSFSKLSAQLLSVRKAYKMPFTALLAVKSTTVSRAWYEEQ